MKTFLVCLGILLGATAGIAAGIREGMSLPEVEAALGAPVSSMSKGDVTVLTYPNRGRVEFEGGKVVRLSRVRHADDPPTAQELAAADAAKTEAQARTEREVEAAAEAKSAKENAAAEAEMTKSNAEHQRQIETAVEQMMQAHDTQRTDDDAEDAGIASVPLHFWVELAISLVVQVGVGMVILKLAFAWADVHADWGQMFLPAFAGAAAGALVRGTAYALWQTDQLFRLDDAVSYGVLLFVLLKATHACTWQRAAGVAMASKLMSMVVWVFLSVALSRVLFT